MILIFPQCHSHLNGDAAALPHAEHDRAEAALAKVLQVRDGIETTLLWGIIQLCSEYSQQMRCEIFILKMGSVICIRLTETSETSRADRVYMYHDSAASMIEIDRKGALSAFCRKFGLKKLQKGFRLFLQKPETTERYNFCRKWLFLQKETISV